MKTVLPQLNAPHVTTALQKSVAGKLLLNLPTLCLDDTSFSDFLSTAKFIHSAESNELKAPSEVRHLFLQNFMIPFVI
jgi:hypothetical protein